LSPALHLGIALALGLLASLRPRSRPWSILAAGMSPLLALLAVWRFGPEERWITGAEGLFEAVTAGLLLGLVLRGGWARQWLMAGMAAVLLMEELDYGQHLLGFATPGWLVAAGSRSTYTNLHNLPGSIIWRLLPIVGLVWLSRPSQAERAQRLGLPTFHPLVLLGLPLTLACAAATGYHLGERRCDEVGEMALVALVYTAWRIPARGLNSATHPTGSPSHRV